MPVQTKPFEDCLSGSWLAARISVEPVLLDVMRRAGELLAVRRPGSTEWLYPAWQYDGRTPRRVIQRILNVARDAGMDEMRVYEVLTAPMGLGGQRRLADLIVEGRDEEVVEAVRSAVLVG
jgi:transposase InsO family protein